MPRSVVRPMRALMAYMATMQLDTVRRHDVGTRAWFALAVAPCHGL
jgi:hypothetical protein